MRNRYWLVGAMENGALPSSVIATTFPSALNAFCQKVHKLLCEHPTASPDSRVIAQSDDEDFYGLYLVYDGEIFVSLRPVAVVSDEAGFTLSDFGNDASLAEIADQLTQAIQGRDARQHESERSRIKRRFVVSRFDEGHIDTYLIEGAASPDHLYELPHEERSRLWRKMGEIRQSADYLDPLS